MRKYLKIILATLLFATLPLRQIAQQPYRPYADDGITLNFLEISNIDFRVFLLYNLSLDDRFSLIAEEESGLFVVAPSDDSFGNGFTEDDYKTLVKDMFSGAIKVNNDITITAADNATVITVIDQGNIK